VADGVCAKAEPASKGIPHEINDIHLPVRRMKTPGSMTRLRWATGHTLAKS
jgi:hypothetical protein